MPPEPSTSNNSKPPLEGYAAYSVPPKKPEKFVKVRRPAPAAAYCAEKLIGVGETLPALFTSSVEAVVMFPAPSVTMKPPAATGAVTPPTKVKAKVPLGMAVLVCENASPEIVPFASISINFKCAASIAYTS